MKYLKQASIRLTTHEQVPCARRKKTKEKIHTVLTRSLFKYHSVSTFFFTFGESSVRLRLVVSEIENRIVDISLLASAPTVTHRERLSRSDKQSLAQPKMSSLRNWGTKHFRSTVGPARSICNVHRAQGDRGRCTAQVTRFETQVIPFAKSSCLNATANRRSIAVLGAFRIAGFGSRKPLPPFPQSERRRRTLATGTRG